MHTHYNRRLLLARQRYGEALEAGDMPSALSVLRGELAALAVPGGPLEPHQLHALAGGQHNGLSTGEGAAWSDVGRLMVCGGLV